MLPSAPRSGAPATLLTGARLGSRADVGAVAVDRGRVVYVGPLLSVAELGRRLDRPATEIDVLHLDGLTVLPGLWDHHVHFDQWSLIRSWIDLSSAAGPVSVVSAVRRRVEQGRVRLDRPLVGYGFRDGLWAQRPHREQLDAVSTDIALVMVSGDLHQAWLNAAALRRYGLPDDGDGLLREDAWQPVMADIRAVPTEEMDAAARDAGRAAAARGVVGIVDYESGDNLAAWPRRAGAEALALRVRASVWPAYLEGAIERGLRTGDVLPATDGLVTMGSLKVITDGSLNTRTAYCHDPYQGEPDNVGLLTVPPEQLVALMRRAWSHGIETAIHAIGDHANTLVLDAFAEVGSAGSVEHAQLLTHSDVARFAALGVTASVQPEHALDDRDVADHFWAGRTGRAFRLRDLVRTGARLAMGSDAPVAPLDPWVTLAAAMSRSRDGREPWHPEQEIDLTIALAASTATGRADVRVGDPADLVLTELDLATAGAADLRNASVSATMLAGRWTHWSPTAP